MRSDSRVTNRKCMGGGERRFFLAPNSQCKSIGDSCWLPTRIKLCLYRLVQIHGIRSEEAGAKRGPKKLIITGGSYNREQPKQVHWPRIRERKGPSR
jgi:hypothetical protein